MVIVAYSEGTSLVMGYRWNGERGKWWLGELCSEWKSSYAAKQPSNCSNASCFCMNSFDDEDAIERKALIGTEVGEMVKIRDIIHGNQTLAFQLKPKMVVLKVSMHCNGCARKVEKHISKMDGVTSFEVDLESKKVVVVGDIAPFEVLESVSRVKFAELWSPPS
ncbi:hypothetical protein H6P81_003832 [Aristolochia fimbriata]|uniref:HMA domain-containing protein n=1 Tax=Aristolochia fimbriata TaxID=158543 RepID=A0AAV7FFQ5_ARIFI|nr:hypothetical protein H6P81_003832 [Aristolochia fimbriata]